MSSNQQMKLHLCAFSALLLIASGIVTARAVRVWSDQELLDQSDLAVIAVPTASADTKEQISLAGVDGQRVIGVETRFTISAVLKADKGAKDLVLHHYRPAPGAMIVPN